MKIPHMPRNIAAVRLSVKLGPFWAVSDRLTDKEARVARIIAAAKAGMGGGGPRKSAVLVSMDELIEVFDDLGDELAALGRGEPARDLADLPEPTPLHPA